ncbi:DinB family protein [Fimbriimonas ginsengisoli]|uniref:Putative DNA polymerase, DinB family n=1 Tax=Fimbriimonas ginsengisoli Gsoil 348 TaxID=661478 RepID=A0A068NV59_FIMGI|nr:DinB family protein [Fimbriimonas ginsengisoli]AIE87336.1 putative DNA polymerase, DinB family [Fimbriimonas ginsengisoli Gsoil 348]
MGAELPILDLLRYDQWATDQMFASVSALTEAQFTHEFAGELSSVRQQCIHMLGASDRYRARIMGEPVPDVVPDSFSTPAEAASYASEVSARYRQMVPTLTPERLAEEIRNDTRRGLFILTVEQTLLQVINHGTFHRGQIACLLKLHGVEPIDSDYILWVNAASPSEP